jgi:hypothetical protein
VCHFPLCLIFDILVTQVLTFILGLTISGDGTTHHYINYKSQFVNFINNPDDSSHKVSQHFLGISSVPDHKSKTQLHGWTSVLKDIYTLLNANPLRAAAFADLDEFAPKTTGINTDHAPDQYCLGSLWEDFRSNCDCKLLGRKAMLSISPLDLLPLISKACDDKIDVVGGLEVQNALSGEEREYYDSYIYE